MWVLFSFGQNAASLLIATDNQLQKVIRRHCYQHFLVRFRISIVFVLLAGLGDRAAHDYVLRRGGEGSALLRRASEFS